MVLAVEDSPVQMLGAFDIMASMLDTQDKVQSAFKTGAGVPWSDQTSCFFCAVGRFFRPGYHNNLVANWLPALDGVVALGVVVVEEVQHAVHDEQGHLVVTGDAPFGRLAAGHRRAHDHVAQQRRRFARVAPVLATGSSAGRAESARPPAPRRSPWPCSPPV